VHTVIVVAHPLAGSFTHSIAASVSEGAREAGHTAEIADIHAEGFDPRFNANDHGVHLKTAGPGADVLAEQARLDRADALVLVFPVYWWSMPGLLKGWIDRVFVNGWAYDEQPGGKLVKKLQHLPVHLLAIGGAGARTYEKHLYRTAMLTQIDHGILDYCGAPVRSSHLLLEPGAGTAPAHLTAARQIGQQLFQASVTPA
jgi:NAD(P)H dehydrogenase (quinone)